MYDYLSTDLHYRWSPTHKGMQHCNQITPLTSKDTKLYRECCVNNCRRLTEDGATSLHEYIVAIIHIILLTHTVQWLSDCCTKITRLGMFGDKLPNHVLVNEYISGQGIMVRVLWCTLGRQILHFVLRSLMKTVLSIIL